MAAVLATNLATDSCMGCFVLFFVVCFVVGFSFVRFFSFCFSDLCG